MLQVLLGAFLISFSSVFVKLVDVGPTTAMFYRFLFGGIALLAVMLVRTVPLWKGKRPMLLAAAGGLVFTLDLFFWHRSILYVGPGLATLLANFQVFILAIFGMFFLGERPALRFYIATPLAFFGFSLLVGWDYGGMARLYRLGILYGLLTAVCYAALALILQKSQRIEGGLSPGAGMVWVCLVGAAAGACAVYPSAETFAIPNLKSLLVLLAYGVLCSAMGWSLISRGLSKVPASIAGLMLILQPVCAFAWDVIFFDRPTTPIQYFGAALTVGAIYMGAVKPQRKK